MSSFTMSDDTKQQIILARKNAAKEKSDQQESWLKIVVKVISWSEGLHSGGIVQQTDKITTKEWDFYCKRSMQINTSHSKKKIEEELENSRKKIKSFDGFED